MRWIWKKKIKNVKNSENAAEVLQEFEQIIISKKSQIIWLAYQQGKILKKLRNKRNLSL